MACDITSGFTLGCRDNSGGIKNVYILSGSITTIDEASEGLISAISGSGTFYKFELALDGTPIPNGIVYSETNGAGDFEAVSINCIATLTAAQQLNVLVSNGIGSTIITVQDACRLNAIRLQ